MQQGCCFGCLGQSARGDKMLAIGQYIIGAQSSCPSQSLLWQPAYTMAAVPCQLQQAQHLCAGACTSSSGLLASAAAVCNCAEKDSEVAGCLQTVLEWHLPGLPSAQACAEMGASLMRAYDNTSTHTKLADGVKGDVLQVLGLLLEHAPEVGFSSS